VASVVKRVLGASDDKIKVRGFGDLLVFRARCCNPIRGENIVGYITRGKGVSVHTAACPNVVNLLYDPERRIDVEWDKGDAVARYTVKLTMEVEDRKGLLAAVSAKIADINTNIRNMEARTDEDKRARIDMTIEISDLKHLVRVMKAVRGVEGVLGVERAARLNRVIARFTCFTEPAALLDRWRSRRSRRGNRAAAARPARSRAPETAPGNTSRTLR
jgi:guanosine-3',5'-bis(diphosphate) 3'-pyrophosphohydrolase